MRLQHHGWCWCVTSGQWNCITHSPSLTCWHGSRLLLAHALHPLCSHGCSHLLLCLRLRSCNSLLRGHLLHAPSRHLLLHARLHGASLLLHLHLLLHLLLCGSCLRLLLSCCLCRLGLLLCCSLLSCLRGELLLALQLQLPLVGLLSLRWRINTQQAATRTSARGTLGAHTRGLRTTTAVAPLKL